ncbi:MAG: BON domain-containing protein [Acidimicrobiales bacterium]
MVKRKLTALVWGAGGAGLAYFLDPDRGRARRARTRDQAAAALRRRRREAESQMRYDEGRLEGVAARASGAGRLTPEDDTDIVQAVHAALSRLDFPTADVNVELVDGVAGLRGQVASAEQIGRVQQAVDQLPGVTGVQSYLHTPGTPAPNKAASLEASG